MIHGSVWHFLLVQVVTAASPQQSAQPASQCANSVLQVRSGRNEGPGVEGAESLLQASSLPPDVYNFGIKAYGSHEALDQAVRMSQEFTTHVGGFELKVHCSSKDDIHDKSMDLDDSYESYGASRLSSLPPSTRVVDIGANLGILTVAYYKTNPKLSFIAVEAMPETFFYLAWNLHENGVPVLSNSLQGPGVLPLNRALGGGQNVTMFYPKFPAAPVVPGHEQSSIHVSSIAGQQDLSQWAAPGSRQYIMQTVSLAQISQEFGLGNGDNVFLLFDCQGCEFDGILPSLSTLSAANQMGGELHCFSPETFVPCEQLKQAICQRGQQRYFRWFERTADDQEQLHRQIECR